MKPKTPPPALVSVTVRLPHSLAKRLEAAARAARRSRGAEALLRLERSFAAR
jgi:predicted transcriptional regulator